MQMPANSVKSVIKVLKYLAKVVIQDAVEIADEYPENLVHKWLLDDPRFM